MSTVEKPIVYSCSGCSNVAQLANDIALALDQRASAQMSCIAGVGGQVKGIVKLAKSGRPIIALDGCPLHCVKSCLQNVEVEPSLHLTLTENGLKKGQYQSSTQDEVQAWCEHIEQQLACEN